MCENRGSGIPTMLREMRRIGSALPEFHNRITRFKVVFPKHALLDAETLTWLNGLRVAGLTPTQGMALALMRSGKQISNQTLRNLGLDGRRATLELRDLVSSGLAVRIGERRHARYVLTPSMREPMASALSRLPRAEAPADPQEQIIAALQTDVGLLRQEIEDRTGLSRMVVLRNLNMLIAAGRVEPTAPQKSPNRRYRKTKQ